jgi:rubrerythrin
VSQNSASGEPVGAPSAIASTDDLLACAHAMEVEAAERYDEFAAQMELHGNLEVAALFARLAAIERKHAEALARDLERRGNAVSSRASLAAPGQEGLETAPGDELHYLMTPAHALQIALANEQRAFAFFAELTERPLPPEVRRLAGRFAAEEEAHIALVREWLARFPEAAADWDYDPDEPRMPD